jgi:2-phospho-L-lactate guanylyltransferase (CobY/MobA/RfbA family)
MKKPTTAAVVPIKDLANAKRRLAAVLNEMERRSLFQAMVEDVLLTLDSCQLIDETWVVTRDPEVKILAETYHARVMPEPENPGLISAVTAAAKQMAAEGIDRLVFVPGDVPMVSVAELNIVLTDLGNLAGHEIEEPGAGEAEFTGEAEFIIVPARDLGGSNCICCSPPDCMKFGFGEDSFRRHLGFARELGITPRVTKLPGLGLDVDTPDDLALLISRLKAGKIRSHTWQYLVESGISERPELDVSNSVDG